MKTVEQRSPVQYISPRRQSNSVQVTFIVIVPYGIHLQYPHPTDADFSWLFHIPGYNGCFFHQYLSKYIISFRFNGLLTALFQVDLG